MYNQKLCLGLGCVPELPVKEQLLLYKKAGFDGFFSGFESREQIADLAGFANKENLVFQSVHAPFHKTAAIWKECEDGIAAVGELKACVEAAADAGVPIVVSHVFIGFDKPDKPTKLGLERFAEVVELASSKNVKIAFENTEGEEFLSAVMDYFKDNPAVGFCWDTGHEQCYNYGKDMTALYGDRLIATHLNDNLGISDFGGHTFWTDDLHLLPFDGIIDWGGIAERLNRAGYNGILTFELARKSKPGRHDNDKYESVSAEIYVAEAYNRACRLAAIKNKSSK